MVKIRTWMEPEDLDGLTDLLLEASEELNYMSLPEEGPNREYAKEHIKNTYLNEHIKTVCIVALDDNDKIIGVASAVICPNPLEMSWLAVTNLVYIKEEYRNKGRLAYYLFKTYFDTCKEMGCKAVSFGFIKNKSPKVVRKFLEHFGLEHVEETYYKEFN